MKPLSLNYRWLICITCILIFTVILFARVRYTMSDSDGTLLVSEAIVKHGAIKLDTYKAALPPNSYRFIQKNGHVYYYFPLGTSVFATPLVFAANLLGFDMLTYDRKLQVIVAGLIGAGSFILLLLIARLFLPPPLNIFTAAVFWFGTSFASTGGTALWSHDLAALFALMAVYLALSLQDKNQNSRAFLIGFCLFSAYFCRPTLSLLSPVLLLYVWLKDKRAALKAAAVTASLLGLFIAFSWNEFHQLLPDYYLPIRLAGENFRTALYGNLLSPARGLLVYSPFLILALCALPWIWKKQPHHRILLLFVAWPVIHWMVVSRLPHWWAGGSFGPRLMFDALPGLFILFILYVNQLRASKQYIQKFILVMAVIFAVGVNTGQGLYNRSSVEWNTDPNVDCFSVYVFNWKYPQFMHTKERHVRRLTEHETFMHLPANPDRKPDDLKHCFGY